MSPIPLSYSYDDSFLSHLAKRRVSKPTNPHGLILEAWAQGFMVGSLIIMSTITMANMRRGVVLHKIILLELLLGIWHGFWIFFDEPIYSWWLSVSAIFLNMSWSLHNVIAWMKLKPFLPKTASHVFIGTVILVQPYWVVEIYANFTYFHNINKVFLKTRPWEALMRDPWWVFTTVALFYVIKSRYELRPLEIVRISPRFGIMMASMVLSIIFIVLDVLSVTGAISSALPTGINPFWKLSFVFKCLTDSVILDDFKTALDRLRAFKISRLGSFAIDSSDSRARSNGQLEQQWEAAITHLPGGAPLPSPEADYVHMQWYGGNKGRTNHMERVDSGKDKVVRTEFGIGSSRDSGVEPEPGDDAGSSSTDKGPMWKNSDPSGVEGASEVGVEGQRPSGLHLPPERHNPHWEELREPDHLAEEDYEKALKEISR